MSASEQPEKEVETGPEEEKPRWNGGQTSDDVREVPLFLAGGSDGRKGNAQDEKDEVGE
jgi:hypothetical protein